LPLGDVPEDLAEAEAAHIVLVVSYTRLLLLLLLTLGGRCKLHVDMSATHCSARQSTRIAEEIVHTKEPTTERNPTLYRCCFIR
jgi:hypothetical protein